LDLRTKITAALIKLYGAQGFNYAWNEGSLAGQTVPHFHLHVIPRKEGDAGIYEYEPRKFLYRPGSREKTPQAELLAFTREIRSVLN
jgi:diadenosine tetraphosphate (Ap4A) HIT family hydrolase